MGRLGLFGVELPEDVRERRSHRQYDRRHLARLAAFLAFCGLSWWNVHAERVCRNGVRCRRCPGQTPWHPDRSRPAGSIPTTPRTPNSSRTASHLTYRSSASAPNPKSRPLSSSSFRLAHRSSPVRASELTVVHRMRGASGGNCSRRNTTNRSRGFTVPPHLRSSAAREVKLHDETSTDLGRRVILHGGRDKTTTKTAVIPSFRKPRRFPHRRVRALITVRESLGVLQTRSAAVNPGGSTDFDRPFPLVSRRRGRIPRRSTHRVLGLRPRM